MPKKKNDEEIIILENDEDIKEKNKTSQEETLLDSYTVDTFGALTKDLKNLEVKIHEHQLPDIEVREVIIKETGNFLNLKDNIINIPIEMLIFPFFTPQKQNKRINFQYTFEDMGVKMMCTLIAKNAADKVFQPSIFEEKIYTYLISMYEAQKEDIESDEYIDFEINDFIVNFLGNKMNRTYYTKVEQALKNLKNTEYQFVVSNHTKLGSYKFEDEEFKLLTYQKLKIGKKIYYRVTLNKNIRKKIKEKRYIKYNSKTLVEIMNIDPIASRIYKYISQMRYDKNMNSINLRTLAAIIPLKTEQVTERIGKDGKIKQYTLCRLKQVLARIEKAFDVLVELKYIEYYESEYNKTENTYHTTYKFNKEKDGTCHISQFIVPKKVAINHKIAEEKEKYIVEDNVSKEENVNIIQIQKTNSKPKEVKKANTIEFSDVILDKIIKIKRNRYVAKSWDKRVETKLHKLIESEDEKYVIDILNELYKNLNEPINSSLVQYINGIIANKALELETKKNENLTLFNNFSAKENSNLSKLTKTGIKRAAKAFTTPIPASSIKSTKSMVDEIKKSEAKTYEQLDEFQKLKVEERAIKLCCNETGMTTKALHTLREKLKPAYINTIKIYIEKVLEQDEDI